jgi:hypothetical protein
MRVKVIVAVLIVGSALWQYSNIDVSNPGDKLPDLTLFRVALILIHGLEKIGLISTQYRWVRDHV